MCGTCSSEKYFAIEHKICANSVPIRYQYYACSVMLQGKEIKVEGD